MINMKHKCWYCGNQLVKVVNRYICYNHTDYTIEFILRVALSVDDLDTPINLIKFIFKDDRQVATWYDGYSYIDDNGTNGIRLPPYFLLNDYKDFKSKISMIKIFG